jgi:hypothetical protein
MKGCTGYNALVDLSSSSNTGCFFPFVISAGKNEEKWPIVIATDRTCCDPDIGLRIHIDELFTVFLPHLRISTKCVNVQLLINDCDLKIAFHRTLRVPEDIRVNILPASPDRFPSQPLPAYSQKLQVSKIASPINIAIKSNVCFLALQYEAMWIFLSTPAGTEYEVSMFTSGMKVVTGKNWGKRKSKYDRAQDYMLVLPQEQLDGFSLDDRTIVREFVAMPIGSGYFNVERSTERDIGGLQNKVTPMTADMDLIYGCTQIYLETKDGEEAMTLYRIKMQIKLLGTLRAHKIETREFSPFSTMSDVALDTTYYVFWDEDRLIALNYTITQARPASSSPSITKSKRALATVVHGPRPIVHAAAPGNAPRISSNDDGRGGYDSGENSAKLATTNSHMSQLLPALPPLLDPNYSNWTKNLELLPLSPVASSNNKSSSTSIINVPVPPTATSRRPSRINFSNQSSTKLLPAWCACKRPSRRRRFLRKGCRASMRTMAPHLRLQAARDWVESRA